LLDLTMPELPEVETMRRGILGVVGSRISGATRLRCRLKPLVVRPAMSSFRRRGVGRQIAAVQRVGKRVVLELDSRDRLVLEPRMTGLILLSDPPDTEHLRFQLDLEGGPADHLWFWDRRGLGSVRLLSPGDYAAQLGTSKLGPDALDVTADDLVGRLGASRRAIKVALLDQQAIAGIGNLYASEILHVAGLHPAQPCRRLTRQQWNRVAAAAHEVLTEAIRYEGSTLSDGTYRTALNDPGRYQNHHRVYGRAGADCPTCGQGAVVRMVQAQRSTFYCPRCQPRRR
jgi:formamidopyrimidine-DNA glycosylase